MAMVYIYVFYKDLAKNVKFKPAGNVLTSKIRIDLNAVKNASKIVVKGNKSRKTQRISKGTQRVTSRSSMI